jgi:hypothetical protein
MAVSNSLAYVSLPPEVLVITYDKLPSDITRFPSGLRVRTAEEFGNGFSLFATQSTLRSETFLVSRFYAYISCISTVNIYFPSQQVYDLNRSDLGPILLVHTTILTTLDHSLLTFSNEIEKC